MLGWFKKKFSSKKDEEKEILSDPELLAEVEDDHEYLQHPDLLDEDSSAVEVDSDLKDQDSEDVLVEDTGGEVEAEEGNNLLQAGETLDEEIGEQIEPEIESESAAELVDVVPEVEDDHEYLQHPDLLDEDSSAVEVDSDLKDQDSEDVLVEDTGGEVEAEEGNNLLQAGETLDEEIGEQIEPEIESESAAELVDVVPEEEAEPEIEDEQEKIKEPEPAVKKAGLFQRLKRGLSRSRESFVRQVDAVFLGKKEIDAELLDDLEEVLIIADLGVQTVMELLDDARKRVARKELADPQALKEVLKEKMLSYLLLADKPAELVMPDSGPFIILVLGVNGVGKTTTIGKMAHKFKQAGSKVLVVAADTFRAAAIDQIKLWCERVGVEVSAKEFGSDPSSVVFDALEYAANQDFDVIIVDTAGRIHTKVNLMEELKKIKRVMQKKCPGAPHEVMLVLDATTGQNALSQTRQFNEAVDLTGLTLTKLDGTAKGGIVVNICREFELPIRFIGIGEKMDDLRDFDPQDFVKALFEK